MFGLSSPHIRRGFCTFLLLLGSGYLHPPLMWGLLRWRKNGRGRLLRIWLALAHGTFCACQMTKKVCVGGNIEYLYFPFNFPTIVWILCCQVALGLCLGHLCQSQRDSSWPDMATYWRRNRFQENSELSFLEIFPWLSEPGLDTQTIWGTLDLNTPVSVSCIFPFHKLKNILVHLRCIFIDFTHFEQRFCIFSSFKKTCLPLDWLQRKERVSDPGDDSCYSLGLGGSQWATGTPYTTTYPLSSVTGTPCTTTHLLASVRKAL